MQVKIQSGEAEVLNSGVVFSYGNQPVEICLKEIDGPKSKSDFRVSFEFSYDDKDKAPKIEEIKVEDVSIYALRLVNYRNSLGYGMLNPLKIASSANGNCLFLIFMVSSWEDDLAKRIDYTIFKQHVQEDKNGEIEIKE